MAGLARGLSDGTTPFVQGGPAGDNANAVLPT